MDNAILPTIKKMLGIEGDDVAFDTDVITHINSALMSLTQLGVGPPEGFMITGSEETWDQLIGLTQNIQAVKSYLYLKVRIIFDPPASSTVLEAMQRSINELEWRLNVQVETGVPEPEGE